MVHASEGLTHWYGRDGSPQYTVKSKDGTDRPATLRDARKLGLVPSVTSIIKCAAAPGLEIWKQNQIMMAALTLPRLPDEPEAEWLKRVVSDSKEQARKAAERGTAIHAAIQGYFDSSYGPDWLASIPPNQVEHWEHINSAAGAVFEWMDLTWSAEASFAHPLGFGGKVDLSCSSGVIDFKTKEFDADTPLKTWDEHAMQLAAYRHGLEMPKARCAIVYVSVNNPGLSRLIEIPEEDLQKGWKCFYSLLQFWKAKSGFESSFERLAA